MNAKELAREKRKQSRLERWGTQHPACCMCGETDDRCLEAHHIAGRKNASDTSLVCRNCHRKLSDTQKDHPQQCADDPSMLERIGHFLLGLGDMLVLAGGKLKEFGAYLLTLAQQWLFAKETCHDPV